MDTTTSAETRFVSGASLGGHSALMALLTRPDLFKGVATTMGSLLNFDFHSDDAFASYARQADVGPEWKASLKQIFRGCFASPALYAAIDPMRLLTLTSRATSKTSESSSRPAVQTTSSFTSACPSFPRRSPTRVSCTTSSPYSAPARTQPSSPAASHRCSAFSYREFVQALNGRSCAHKLSSTSSADGLTPARIRIMVDPMGTTLDLPESLLDEAQRLLGFKSKTDTVVLSLTELVRRRRIDELKSLAGKVRLELDLDQSRRRPSPELGKADAAPRKRVK